MPDHDTAPLPTLATAAKLVIHLKPRSALRAFLRSGASGGLVLMAAAVAAMIVANSGLGDSYFRLLAAQLGPLSLLHWIDDALMSLFFQIGRAHV